jgi:subtilase family serine protease
LRAPAGSLAYYTPAQIRDAYGINALALGAGLPTPTLDGTGQTIAIVDAYDDPDIDEAVDAFDSQFSLTDTGPTIAAQYGPASSFLPVLNQSGQATSLPGTDPSGAGNDNWELEESLDVEWVHAIAPGAQVILVEANSQSLSDLMACVTTAASQPGVSVVSMSWEFAEGQSVVAADEAMYDPDFAVPGVTFVASTGDYGAADPEYPAFSPNVVAVGGTSLTLNTDNSYNSETGWGYQSSALGMFIGSGGGISQYEPEPAYQEGVQSTGARTTPDVALVADPATGAWVADPYNLDPSNPFEVVGGTSLSAPVWAGLIALVNQGRVAADEATLNSVTPTDTQRALYMLPQSDFNTIDSGTNGYSAGAGYNLVTGLGTPVANLLVPDLGVPGGWHDL